MQNLSWRHLSITVISQLLPTQFWPNSKGSSWDPWFQLSWSHLSRKHWSWQNLPISRIFQLLLTRFWQNFLDTIFGGRDLFWSKNFWTIFCLTQSFLDLQMFLDTKFKKVSTQNFFRSQNFVKPKLCWPIIGSKLFWTKFFLDLIISWPKKHKFNKNFFGPNSFCTQNFAYICFD